MGMKPRYLDQKTYNNLEVLDQFMVKPNLMARCKCLLCGREVVRRTTVIRSGKTKDCGRHHRLWVNSQIAPKLNEILEMSNQGMVQREIAKELGVSVQCIQQFLGRYTNRKVVYELNDRGKEILNANRTEGK